MADKTAAKGAKPKAKAAAVASFPSVRRRSSEDDEDDEAGSSTVSGEEEEKEADESSSDDGPDEDPSTSTKSKKIMLTILGPHGEVNKLMLKRATCVAELRQACATLAGRLARETEIRLDGKRLFMAKTAPFEDRGPPYEIHWEAGDRMHNLLKENNLKSLSSRAPGTKGLNRTVMHFCALNGDIDLAKEALEDKQLQNKILSLVNAQDTFGDTALTIAAIWGYEDIVELMLDRNTDINKKTIHGRTALMLAAEHGHVECVRALLRGGADEGPIYPGTTLPTARYLAKLNGRVNTLKAMKENDQAKMADDFFANLNLDEGDGGGGDETTKKPEEGAGVAGSRRGSQDRRSSLGSQSGRSSRS